MCVMEKTNTVKCTEFLAWNSTTICTRSGISGNDWEHLGKKLLRQMRTDSIMVNSEENWERFLGKCQAVMSFSAWRQVYNVAGGGCMHQS